MRRLGITQPVVAAYESGRRQPTVPTSMRMLGAAGFDLRLGLTPHEDHDEVVDALKRQRSSDERDRWHAYQRNIVDSARRHLEES